MTPLIKNTNAFTGKFTSSSKNLMRNVNMRNTAKIFIITIDLFFTPITKKFNDNSNTIIFINQLIKRGLTGLPVRILNKFRANKKSGKSIIQ